MILLKNISIFIMSFFYVRVGVKHFIDPAWFIQIMPPYLPWHHQLVYLSGLFEIVLGFMLIIPKTRQIAADGLILLLIAVYPANLYLALNQLPQDMMGISSFAASWVRLPIQFIFLGLAYWHSKK